MSDQRRMLRGGLVTLLGHGASQLLRLVSNLILTRILAPEYFGPMLIVNGVLVGLHMFSDVGVGASIIQHKDGVTPAFLNTAWTIQALRGVYLALLSCALGPFFARVYPNMPELAWLIPLAGLSALFDGFQSTKLFVANRAMLLGRFTALEVATMLVSVCTNVAFAWHTPSVFALAIGGVAAAIFRTVASHIILPGAHNRFAWDKGARASIFGFGRWVFFSTALTFLALHLDRLLLGKLADTHELGLYSNALVWATIPREVMAQLSARVLFPAISERVRNQSSLMDLRVMRGRLNLAVAVLGGGLAGFAVPLIAVVYDDRYASAAPIVSALSLGTALSVLESGYGAVALAHGQPKFIAFGNLSKVIVFAACAQLTFTRFGVVGVAWLSSLAQVGLWLINAYGAGELRDLVGDMRSLFFGTAIAAFAMGMFAFAKTVFGPVRGAEITIGVVGCAAVVLVASGAFFLHRQRASERARGAEAR